MLPSSDKIKKWSIFLSHSSEDKSFVDWLYEKFRSVNQTTWYDKCELLVGDPLLERIEEGLKGSEFLIVVVSQAAIQSNPELSNAYSVSLSKTERK